MIELLGLRKLLKIIRVPNDYLPTSVLYMIVIFIVIIVMIIILLLL